MFIQAFIMAGGSGERFWPLSRTAKPKHLLKLFSDQTLLELTLDRLQPAIPLEQTCILTNIAQAPTIESLMQSSTAHGLKVLAEPAKRDTAPAAALATAWALRMNPESIVILLPADAWIKDSTSFQKQLMELCQHVESTSAMGTLAITPTHPATGYGYLKLGASVSEGCYQVNQFVEKPNQETAQSYLQSGNYGWNAGIFAWKAQTFLAECQRLQPQLADWIHLMTNCEDWDATLQKTFASLPKISVDYAIMEKAQNVIALKAEFDWDDVGTWTALPSHLPHDEQGNTLIGKTSLHNSSGNIVFAESRHVALCGVKDLVVVETADAVLICHKDAVQEVKHLQSKLPEQLK